MEEGKRERWTAKKKKELVLQIIKKEKSLADACRAHDLKQSEVQDWINTFLKSGEQGLKTSSKEVKMQYERELKEMKAKIGELVLENDILKKAKALDEEEETSY